MEINLSGSLDTSNLEEYLISDVPFQEIVDGNVQSLMLNLRHLNFISSSGLVTLASVIKFSQNQANIRGNSTLKQPIDKDVRTYLSRIDFYNRIGVEQEEDFNRRDPKRRFLELSVVESESEVHEVSKKLCGILKDKTSVDKKFLNVISYSLGEILENVFHHAQSPINGLVSAQYYPKQGEVNISIADCGIGIKESLTSNPELSSRVSNDKTALELALKVDTTSKPSKHTGEGLYITSNLIKKNRGNLYLHSGNATLTIRENTAPLIENASYWQGTLIDLRFDTNNKVSISSVVNSNGEKRSGGFLQEV